MRSMEGQRLAEKAGAARRRLWRGVKDWGCSGGKEADPSSLRTWDGSSSVEPAIAARDLGPGGGGGAGLGGAASCWGLLLFIIII